MRVIARHPTGRRMWFRHGLVVFGLVLIFYTVPLGPLDSIGRTALSVGLTLIGVVLLGWAITAQLRRQLADDPDAELHSLVMLLELVAVVFALGYYLLDVTTPGEMAGLRTRTDALYFTLSTLTTIGFGDVHAAGQVARVMVIVQMVFDVIFVAAVVAVLSGRLRARAGRH
jgi:voltage-gated potassium channel